MMLFAITTILGWYWYAETAVTYLFGVRFKSVMKLLLIVMIGVSAVSIYEVRTVMRLGKEAAEEKRQSREEAHEAKMREAVAKEIERLKAEGLTPEDLEVQHDTGETDPGTDRRPDDPA
jgi:uncharacterized membrane protein